SWRGAPVASRGLRLVPPGGVSAPPPCARRVYSRLRVRGSTGEPCAAPSCLLEEPSMRTTLREVAALVFAAAIALSIAGWAAESPAQPPGGPGTPPGGPGAPGGPGMGAPPDTNDPDVKALMQLRAKVKGHEQAPAESVFENIKSFRGAPAQRIPIVMGAFTRALGSHCSLCHAGNGKWASDEKKEKNIARGMMRMTSMLNDSLHAIANI